MNSEAKKIEFGKKVQDAMLRRGWNQSELGRRAGLKRDNISCYVRGTTLPEPAPTSQAGAGAKHGAHRSR
jgi:transcriptional regulator with XRE-family HTH domain